MKKLRIQYFSDVLCVWAYVGQVRIDELLHEHGAKVELSYHFIDVFGDTPGRLATRWNDRGGMAAYGQHVLGVAAKFPHAPVHPEIWSRNIPNSSLRCHEFLYAVQDIGGSEKLAQAAWKLRQEFFQNAVDVSALPFLLGVAEDLDLSRSQIEAHFHSGMAAARLSSDLREAAEQGLKVSPTLVFNEGRQRLQGNVGYRVIEANINELLTQDERAHSWC